jgi:hypothetical protein
MLGLARCCDGVCVIKDSLVSRCTILVWMLVPHKAPPSILLQTLNKLIEQRNRLKSIRKRIHIRSRNIIHCKSHINNPSTPITPLSYHTLNPLSILSNSQSLCTSKDACVNDSHQQRLHRLPHQPVRLQHLLQHVDVEEHVCASVWVQLVARYGVHRVDYRAADGVLPVVRRAFGCVLV